MDMTESSVYQTFSDNKSLEKNWATQLEAKQHLKCTFILNGKCSALLLS